MSSFVPEMLRVLLVSLLLSVSLAANDSSPASRRRHSLPASRRRAAAATAAVAVDSGPAMSRDSMITGLHPADDINHHQLISNESHGDELLQDDVTVGPETAATSRPAGTGHRGRQRSGRGRNPGNGAGRNNKSNARIRRIGNQMRNTTTFFVNQTSVNTSDSSVDRDAPFIDNFERRLRQLQADRAREEIAKLAQIRIQQQQQQQHPEPRRHRRQADQDQQLDSEMMRTRHHQLLKQHPVHPTGELCSDGADCFQGQRPVSDDDDNIGLHGRQPMSSFSSRRVSRQDEQRDNRLQRRLRFIDRR